jgi:hypothetical protein
MRTRIEPNKPDKSEMAGDATLAKTLIFDLRKLTSLDSDPDKQAILRKLLVEEADKLASNREQLENHTRLAAKAGAQIRESREHLERLDGFKSPGDTRDCQRSVDVMEIIQQLVENFRRQLLTMYPYSVTLRNEIVSVCGTLDEARRRAQQFANINPGAVVTVAGHTGEGEL